MRRRSVSKRPRFRGVASAPRSHRRAPSRRSRRLSAGPAKRPRRKATRARAFETARAKSRGGTRGVSRGARRDPLVRCGRAVAAGRTAGSIRGAGGEGGRAGDRGTAIGGQRPSEKGRPGASAARGSDAVPARPIRIPARTASVMPTVRATLAAVEGAAIVRGGCTGGAYRVRGASRPRKRPYFVYVARRGRRTATPREIGRSGAGGGRVHVPDIAQEPRIMTGLPVRRPATRGCGSMGSAPWRSRDSRRHSPGRRASTQTHPVSPTCRPRTHAPRG